MINVSSCEIGYLDSVALAFEIPGLPHPSDWVGAYCVDNETAPSPDAEFFESVKINNRPSGVLELKRLSNMCCSWLGPPAGLWASLPMSRPPEYCL